MEHGEPLEIFRERLTEYLDAFAEEERRIVGDELYQAPIMKTCWDMGGFWYFHAINSPKGLFRVFNEHIQPLFCASHCNMSIFDEAVAPYWSTGAGDLMQSKIEYEKTYQDQIRQAFNPGYQY